MTFEIFYISILLGREKMQEFLKKHNETASFVVVRTRINNERMRLAKRMKKRKADLGMI